MASDSKWRAECIEARGGSCRRCGSFQHIEMDHLWPKGQQGKSVVENGLPLCGAWGSCGAHALKTAGSLLIERSWLDDDQIEWLAEVGWVLWDPEDGSVSGNGWRHFAPVDPATGRTRERRPDEQHITPDGVQTKETPMNESHLTPVDDDGLLPEDDLAAAADAALADEPEAVQDHLDGTNYAKLKFVGMAYEQPVRPALREEVTYIVRGTCVGHSEEVMADKDIRETAKIQVNSVELQQS